MHRLRPAWQWIFVVCLVFSMIAAYAISQATFGNYGLLQRTLHEWVTEDNTYIYIENNYYRACIRKGAQDSWQRYFGTIEKFFIKPEDSVNVMSSGSTIRGDCHKFYRKIPDFFAQYGQWQGSGFGPYVYTPVTIVANTSDYAILYHEFSIGNDKNLRIREWKTFYYDRPYILVQWEDQWVNEEKRFEQHQVDIGWNSSWTDRRIYMSHINGIVTEENRPLTGKLDEPRYVAWKRAELNETYCWMAFHNNATSDGMGIILLDFTPRGNVGELLLEDYWSASANDFNRIQIGVEQEYHGSSYGFPSSDDYFGRNHVSYLLCCYDDSFSDFNNWTSIQELAKDMWTPDYEPQYSALPAYGDAVSASSGNVIWDCWAGYDNTSDRIRTFVPSHYGYPVYEGAGGECSQGLYVKMTSNNQSNVDLWNGTLSTENGYQAPDYSEANVTYTRNGSLVHNLKVSITYQTFSESSRVYIMCQWTATNTVILDKLWLKFSISVPGAWYIHSNYNSTCGKIENNKSYLWGRFGCAYFITQGTYYHDWETPWGVIAIDNGGLAKSYPTGTTWTAALFLQSFGQESPFDFTKDFMQKEKWCFFWNNHYIKLFNTTNNWTYPISILDFGSKEFHLLYHDFNLVTNQLYMHTEGDSTAPANFRIKCSAKGAPSNVTFNGNLVTFNYDPASGLLAYQGQHDTNHMGESVVSWG